MRNSLGIEMRADVVEKATRTAARRGDFVMIDMFSGCTPAESTEAARRVFGHDRFDFGSLHGRILSYRETPAKVTVS